MNRMIACALTVAFGANLHAQAIHLNGLVSDSSGRPVAKAVVDLSRQGSKDTTGSDGTYSIIIPSVSIQSVQEPHTGNMRLNNGVLEYTVGQPSPVKIEVYDMKGNARKSEFLPEVQPGTYHFDIASDPLSNQMLIVKASIGSVVQAFRYFPLQKMSGGEIGMAGSGSAGMVSARSAATVDTLAVSAVGYKTSKIALTSYVATVNVTLADNTRVYNPCPTNGTACKILPFGDSITRGAKSSDDGGYRSPLFKLIVAGKQKATFVGSAAHGPTTVSGQTFPRSHEGHAGWTIDPGFNQISSSYSGISKLVPSPALDGKPDIILLMIGTNDLFARETDKMATRLEALLDKIALNAPRSLIVLAQITPRGTNDPNLTAYNAKIPSIIKAHAAKGQHIIGVDMSKLPVSLLADGTHPNDKGYAYMADIWYAAIKDLLPR